MRAFDTKKSTKHTHTAQPHHTKPHTTGYTLGILGYSRACTLFQGEMGSSDWLMLTFTLRKSSLPCPPFAHKNSTAVVPLPHPSLQSFRSSVFCAIIFPVLALAFLINQHDKGLHCCTWTYTPSCANVSV